VHHDETGANAPGQLSGQICAKEAPAASRGSGGFRFAAVLESSAGTMPDIADLRNDGGGS